MSPVVLDTNVWLDWLVFDDAALAPLKRAQADGAIEIFSDEACARELVAVLNYDLGKYLNDMVNLDYPDLDDNYSSNYLATKKSSYAICIVF